MKLTDWIKSAAFMAMVFGTISFVTRFPDVAAIVFQVCGTAFTFVVAAVVFWIIRREPEEDYRKKDKGPSI